MATVKRDTSGIKQAAQLKRLQTLARAEAGIQRLIEANQPVTFASVAEAANVSTSWLYQQPELVERIKQMRSEHPKSKTIPIIKQSGSDSLVKDKVIYSLRNQVKALKAEIQALTEQIDFLAEIHASSAVDKNKELEILLEQALKDLKQEKQKNKRLQTQIRDLKLQLTQHKNLVSIASTGELSPAIVKSLEDVQIQPNKGIRDALAKLPEIQALAAIAAFKEQISKPGKVINDKRAYFVSLLQRSAEPNKEGQQDTVTFNNWFELAHSLGIVMGATLGKKGERICYDIDGNPYSFQDYWLKQYPIEELERQADDLIKLMP